MATIITKNSSTSSATPAAGDLVKGELAINVTDKKLYTKDNSATVVRIVGSLGNQEASAAAITGGTVAGVAQTGGTINNTPIGATTAAAITGTTVTATTGFVGALTGAVTGNTTGTHTGAVTGNVTGNLTGNVTASTGTSTFNDVTINGGLNMDASSAATITNLTSPTNSGDAATKGYVDTAISNLVDGAPAALDTLNELAAALNDDASFSTTVTNSIAAKLPLAGGTMTGAIAMGTSKITGLGTPTANTDAATKGYVDTSAAGGLPLSGGTMTGNIVMGANKVTSTATPSTDDDLTRKAYVDSILGSATSAATSASAAATSETNAGNSASAASSSASAASASASSAAASYDSFDDRYLGPKSSAPTVDNDGNALLTGALYFDTTANEMRVYTGSTWKATGSAVNGTATRQVYTATASQTTFAIVYDVGFVDVYLNGVKLVVTSDFTATSGTNIVLVTGATAGDIVDIVAYGAFNVANTYTQAAADAKFATFTGTETLTNKTLTAPVLTTPNITTGLLVGGASGSAGNVLTSGGSGVAPSWVAASSGALTLLSTVTASTSSTVDIETTFNSTYDAYLLVATGVTISATDNFYCRMKIGGSYLSTSTYANHLHMMKGNDGAYTSVTNSGAAQINITGNLPTSTASHSIDFVMRVYTPSSTTFQKLIDWQGVTINNTPALMGFVGAGLNTGTDALTGVQFFTGGGTINAGKFRLYGIANS